MARVYHPLRHMVRPGHIDIVVCCSLPDVRAALAAAARAGGHAIAGKAVALHRPELADLLEAVAVARVHGAVRLVLR